MMSYLRNKAFLLAEMALPLQYHSTVMDGSPTGPTLASKWERSPSLTVTSLSGVEKTGAEYFVVISSFVCCWACFSTCFKYMTSGSASFLQLNKYQWMSVEKGKGRCLFADSALILRNVSLISVSYSGSITRLGVGRISLGSPRPLASSDSGVSTITLACVVIEPAVL